MMSQTWQHCKFPRFSPLLEKAPALGKGGEVRREPGGKRQSTHGKTPNFFRFHPYWKKRLRCARAVRYGENLGVEEEPESDAPLPLPDDDGDDDPLPSSARSVRRRSGATGAFAGAFAGVAAALAAVLGAALAAVGATADVVAAASTVGSAHRREVNYQWWY